MKKRMEYKARLTITVLLLIILVIFSEVVNIKSIEYYRNFLLLGLPYYYIGMLIKEKQKKCSIKKFKILLPIIILINYIEVFILKTIGHEYILEHYITTIFFSIAVILFVLSYNNTVIKSNIFSKIGRKYSLEIYLMHVVVIDIIIKFEEIINAQINQYFLCIVTFIISIVASKILEEIKQILGGKINEFKRHFNYKNN